MDNYKRCIKRIGNYLFFFRTQRYGKLRTNINSKDAHKKAFLVGKLYKNGEKPIKNATKNGEKSREKNQRCKTNRIPKRGYYFSIFLFVNSFPFFFVSRQMLSRFFSFFSFFQLFLYVKLFFFSYFFFLVKLSFLSKTFFFTF